MHELSIAGAVLNTAVKHSDGQPVGAVALRVGTLRQVVPDSLAFYWEIVARDTCCEGARLEIAVIETALACARCQCEWRPAIPDFRCPVCLGEAAVLAGEELEVDYIELREAVHA